MQSEGGPAHACLAGTQALNRGLAAAVGRAQAMLRCLDFVCMHAALPAHPLHNQGPRKGECCATVWCERGAHKFTDDMHAQVVMQVARRRLGSGPHLPWLPSSP